MRLRIGAALIFLTIAAIAGFGHAVGWSCLVEMTNGRFGTVARDAFDDVARYVASAPSQGHRFDIAAAVTDVGHWRLANRDGEPFTADGPHEFARALATLAPDADTSGKQLSVLLDGETIFRRSRSLGQWPPSTELSVLIEGRPFEVVRPEEADAIAGIAVNPGLVVEAGDRATFIEMLHQLERPLARDEVRMVALEPGGATGMARVPVVEKGARHARPDIVDPGYIGDALGNVSGQIVLVSGRLAGGRLIYKPGSGPAGEIAIDALKKAVRSSDASLVLLDASSARQPGTRNWLWQRIALSNVNKALGGATLGDFLRALAGEPGRLRVRAAAPSGNRIDLMLQPAAEHPAASVTRLTQVVSGTWSNIVSETAGTVSVHALRASLLTVARQAEIDRRILPGIPYVVQVGYLVLVIVGSLGWPVVNAWWRQIWPQEIAGDYSSRAGLVLARAVRRTSLILLFLPLAGLPALLVRLARAFRIDAA